MPYTIQKKGDKYKIIRKDTGAIVGTSNSRADAEASIRARLAGEHGWRPAKRRGK